MLELSILEPEGIIEIKAESAITTEDIANLNKEANGYLADHARIHGVLISAKSFPGWESFSAFADHVKFIRDENKNVDRLALVTDSHVVEVAEGIAKVFVKAEIKRFRYAEYEEAVRWLKPARRRNSKKAEMPILSAAITAGTLRDATRLSRSVSSPQ